MSLEPRLTPDQLAQYRGCWPDNPCYFDCVEAARWAIEHPDEMHNPEQLERARVWAAEETRA